MKVRGLLIAVIALAVLAGAVYWSNKSEEAKAAKPAVAADASPKLITIPEDQLTSVSIAHKDAAPTVLEKNESGKWKMAAPKTYAVDQDAANTTVSAATGLSWDRLVEEKATDFKPYGLEQPAVAVELKSKAGKTQKLLLGDETPTGSNYYARIEGDPRVFTVLGATKNSLDKSAEDLRDRRMMTFDVDKVSRIEVAGKTQSFELGRNSQNEWQVVKPKPGRADAFQVEDLVRKLKDARMETAPAAKDAPKPNFIGALVATVKVTDNAGTQQMEIRHNMKDNFYFAKSSAVEGVYKVPEDLGTAAEKGLAEFVNKKLLDFAFNELSKIEIRDGAKNYVFQKSGDTWTSGGQQMDSVSVQVLTDKLRELVAEEVTDKGFTKADVEIKVSWADGKHVEKVQLSNAGEKWMGIRENEPAVYALIPKLVTDVQRAAADVKAAPKGAKK